MCYYLNVHFQGQRVNFHVLFNSEKIQPSGRTYNEDVAVLQCCAAQQHRLYRCLTDVNSIFNNDDSLKKEC